MKVRVTITYKGVIYKGNWEITDKEKLGALKREITQVIENPIDSSIILNNGHYFGGKVLEQSVISLEQKLTKVE